jgi:hypothetical protein
MRRSGSRKSTERICYKSEVLVQNDIGSCAATECARRWHEGMEVQDGQTTSMDESRLFGTACVSTSVPFRACVRMLCIPYASYLQPNVFVEGRTLTTKRGS